MRLIKAAKIIVWQTVLTQRRKVAKSAKKCGEGCHGVLCVVAIFAPLR
jgi:hypothetical protein